MRLGLGISTKLILMATVIVLGAIGVVVTSATDLFREESLTRVQETNKDVADAMATQVFNFLEDTARKMNLMAQTVATQKDFQLSAEAQELVQNVLRTNDEFISFAVYRPDPKRGYVEAYFVARDEVLAEYDLTLDKIRTAPLSLMFQDLKRKKDTLSVVNSSPIFKKPVLTLSVITKPNSATKERLIIRADVRQNPIIKLFSKKTLITSYIVDDLGKLISHSNPDYIVNAYNMSSIPIVQKIQEGKINNHQMEYEDDEGEVYLGAFKSVGVGKIAVVAQVSRSEALKAVMKVQKLALLITTIVVGLAFIFNFIFSQSLTSPLENLYSAAMEIGRGNFKVKLQSESDDEIGALTDAFSGMVKGLEERDKLRGAFNKFHSKAVAQKILSGEVKLGGERRLVTVFFSDIRGFTQMSETMSPDLVVNMLNEYMSEMVKIVYKHEGVLDKYVGDAIMAIWGAPDAIPDAPYRAVCAALEMREALIQLNERRKAKGQPEIKIGMGVHSGEAVAGNFGYEERMEYTVIGDNVNQASRIESATKDVGTDFLISDATYILIKDRGVEVGPPLSIKVKGKSQNLTVYQVIGIKDATGALKTVLSPEQIKKIKETTAIQNAHHETAGATAPQMNIGGMPGPIPMPTQAPQVLPIPQVQEWFLVRDASHPVPEGPYNEGQLRLISSQPGFSIPLAYVYREGDAQMTPLAEAPGFSRRAHTPLPQPAIPLPPEELMLQARTDEWYVYGGPSGIVGPYTRSQLKMALDSGNLTRTTYCWEINQPHWIYLFQVPGFDRRAGLTSEKKIA